MAHNCVDKNEGSLMAFIEVRSSKAIRARAGCAHVPTESATLGKHEVGSEYSVIHRQLSTPSPDVQQNMSTVLKLSDMR